MAPHLMTSHPSPDPDDLNFSILPPNDLLSEWEDDILYAHENIDITLLKAYQAGADAELEACGDFLQELLVPSEWITGLRAARRPKPPSLKEQALEAHGPEPLPEPSPHGDAILNAGAIERHRLVRRALEQLDD